MKMKTKIVLGFGCLVLIMALVGGLAWWNMRSIATDVSLLQTRYLPESKFFSALKGDFQGARVEVFHAFQSGKDGDMDLVRLALKRIQTTLSDLSEQLTSSRIMDEELRTTVRELRELVSKYTAEVEELWESAGYVRETQETRAGLVSTGISDVRQLGMQIFGLISAANERGRKGVTKEVDAIAGSAASSSVLLLVGIGLALALAVVFSVVLASLITRPVGAGMAFAGRLAKGDFTTRLPAGRQDEIGVLAGSLNSMVDQLSIMLEDLLLGVSALAESSGGLRTVSDDMATGAKGTVHRAEAVSAASEEMSANMISVAAAMEQASSNVNIVASAAEEMSNTIAEIARSADKARRVTGDSVAAASAASEQFSRLDTAARQIGEVTETISEISAQTNLLALNATIEAARAGESGKGFAVVAGEIKDLARQTAEATAEISRKIRGIQEVTEAAVGRIGDISSNIESMDEMVSSIAVAVEQQSATTREIAENIQQASGGIREVTVNAAQSSTVSGEIAKDIAEVSGAAGRMLDNSVHVQKEADDLAGLAERLRSLGERFRIR